MAHIKLITIFITFLAFHISLNANKPTREIVTEYLCHGDLKSLKTTIKTNRDGSYTQKVKLLYSNGEVVIGNDSGKNLEFSKLASGTHEKGSRSILEGGNVLSAKSIDLIFHEGDKKLLSNIKSGLIFKSKFTKKEEWLNADRTRSRTYNYTLKVLDKKTILNKKLGSIESFLILILMAEDDTQNNGLSNYSELIGHYSPRYGYINFTWLEHSDSKTINSESCHLANWEETKL
ncbi:MAG: hypothetical protein K9K67_12225 [Bacteriovoracaceae bacterium]|nr:hypothetical protein [Bacteriovoracaceae bacterium]